MSSENPSETPKVIQSTGVIGAGLMGAAIADEHAVHQVPVKLFDTNQEAVARALLSMAGPAQAVDCLEELNDVDLVVEAVAESIGVKRKLFKKLEEQVPSTTLLASNTSSISISKLGARLKHPERFCGLHFCHPVRERKLVEVIRGEQTSPQTIETAVAHIQELEKLPIVVQDCPGFVVNRILALYLNEALSLLQQGISVEQIEQSAHDFGMPIGPIHAFDAIGIDIALRVGAQMQTAYPERMTSASDLILKMFRDGYLGEKNGQGFYLYDETGTRTEELDPQVQQFISEGLGEQKPLTSEEITYRLMLPWVLEATRLLEEDIVTNPADIDLALVHGLGFPEDKGGILAWADQLGAAKIVELLEHLEALGEQFRVTEYLKRCVVEGSRLKGN